MGGVGSQGGMNCVSSLEGNSHKAPAYTFREQRNDDVVQISVLEKAAPPALALKTSNSVLLCLSLVLFDLLLQCWRSEQGSLSASKFMHGPFKRVA